MRKAARLPVLLLPALLFACKIATIRPIESGDHGDDAQAFDATTYAASLWAKDVPAALARAVDLRELLPAVAADAEAAGARWGRREGNGPYTVIVKGSGRVQSVDTSSRVGMASVAIETPGGPVPVRLQIGPILRGTAIRDALVSFDQFVNQIQYADVASALTARVEHEVLASLDREALVGKRVRFVGATTLGTDRPLTVTPVRLERDVKP